MSYILDALKRAESERGESPRGGAAESGWSPLAAPEGGNPHSWRWALAATACLGLTGLAVMAWSTKGNRDEPLVVVATNAIEPLRVQPDAVPVPVPSLTPAPAPARVPAPAPAIAPPTTVEAASEPEPSPTLQTAPLPSPDMLDSLPVPPPLPPGALPRQILQKVPLPPAPSKTLPQPPKATTGTLTAPPIAPPQPSKPIARSGIGQPSIEITGTSYSTDPSLRMLIANGRVVKEGQELSPGLTLEAIGPRSAVFNQAGSRFNVNY